MRCSIWPASFHLHSPENWRKQVPVDHAMICPLVYSLVRGLIDLAGRNLQDNWRFDSSAALIIAFIKTIWSEVWYILADFLIIRLAHAAWNREMICSIPMDNSTMEYIELVVACHLSSSHKRVLLRAPTVTRADLNEIRRRSLFVIATVRAQRNGTAGPSDQSRPTHRIICVATRKAVSWASDSSWGSVAYSGTYNPVENATWTETWSVFVSNIFFILYSVRFLRISASMVRFWTNGPWNICARCGIRWSTWIRTTWFT